MLNTKFEMKKNMGSKISIQDIDQKASDFAKANFMKQLKEHHQNLENENKHYKEANANLKEEIHAKALEIARLEKRCSNLELEIEEPKELDDK